MANCGEICPVQCGIAEIENLSTLSFTARCIGQEALKKFLKIGECPLGPEIIFDDKRDNCLITCRNARLPEISAIADTTIGSNNSWLILTRLRPVESVVEIMGDQLVNESYRAFYDESGGE